jgi:thiol-disulfide isomerase/thioredoxin
MPARGQTGSSFQDISKMPAQYLQFIALLVVLGAVLWLLQWVMNRQARRSEGLNVPDTSEVDGEMHNPLRVYYFYSKTCGPCKAMEALTNRVCEESDNLIKVDIAQHSHMAREFGIAGVPSFVVVQDGVIRTVKLGRVSESWLRKACTKGAAIARAD